MVISSVIRSPIAACTAGSEPRGATVCSNRSVSPIWSVRPGGQHGQGGQQRRHHDQDDDNDRAPPLSIPARAHFCHRSRVPRSQLLLELAQPRAQAFDVLRRLSHVLEPSSRALVLASPRMDELTEA